jgi:chromate reductase
MPVRIVALAGSLREGSLNKKLIRLAAAAARAAGAEVTDVDLRDFTMPIYDGDIQDREGIPGHAGRFKALLVSHDAMLIASPEYNRSIPGGLKNAIDWASRSLPGEPPLTAFTGKTVGIMSASPGAVGGLIALMHLRAVLGTIGALVVPEQIALAKAGEAFDDSGGLKDARHQAIVEKIAQRVVKLAALLKV